MTDIIALRNKITGILTEERIDEGAGRIMLGILGFVAFTYSALLTTALMRFPDGPPGMERPDVTGAVDPNRAQYCLDEHGHLVTIKLRSDRQNPNRLNVRVVYRNPGEPGTGLEEVVNGNQLVPLFLANNDRIVAVVSVAGEEITVRDIQSGAVDDMPVDQVRPFLKGQINGTLQSILRSVLQNTRPNHVPPGEKGNGST